MRLSLEPASCASHTGSGPQQLGAARVGMSASRNLDERCRRVVGRPVEVRSEDDSFTVTVPLLPTAA